MKLVTGRRLRDLLSFNPDCGFCRSAINETADNGYKSAVTAGSTDRDGKEKKHGWEQKKKQSEGQNKKRKTSHVSHEDQESLQKKPRKRRLGTSEGHGTVDSRRQMCVCCVCLSYKMNRPLHSHKHLTCASCLFSRRTILQVQLLERDHTLTWWV